MSHPTSLATPSRTKPDLAMNWSRTEGALVIRRENGTPVEDGQLLSAYLGKAFLSELERRGYDLSTVRFSVRHQASR